MREATKNAFNKNINKVMELLDHDVFIVYLKKEITCTCRQKGTDQSDPKCKRCLGTGYKIKIKKAKAVCQESSVPATIRNSSGFVISKNYFVKSKDRLENDDIIVDGTDVSFVFQAPDYASFDGEYVFQKCSTMPKKLDTKIFLEHFGQIVGR